MALGGSPQNGDAWGKGEKKGAAVGGRPPLWLLHHPHLGRIYAWSPGWGLRLGVPGSSNRGTASSPGAGSRSPPWSPRACPNPGRWCGWSSAGKGPPPMGWRKSHRGLCRGQHRRLERGPCRVPVAAADAGKQEGVPLRAPHLGEASPALPRSWIERSSGVAPVGDGGGV